jgi:hypothetical protein
MRNSALIIAAATLAITAFAAPLPSDAKKPILYFPVEVGAKWVYQWEDKEEMTREVTAVEDRKGAKIVTVSQMGKDNKLSPCEVVSVTEQGLVLLSDSEHEFKPPVCLLKIPYKPGDSWKCDSNWLGLNHLGATAKVLEIEELEVPAGKFKTIRVERTYALNGTSGGDKWDDLFAPGIGRVKMVDHFDGSVTSAVLKSFTPGKR